MRIDITGEVATVNEEPIAGNVYQVRGGRGASKGHMMIILAVTNPEPYDGQKVLMLIVNKKGEPVGVTSYGVHYVRELTPIAFVDGMDEISLPMRSL